ncbi:TIGR03773 family transporter-associated surface protein [Bifidobacteriaceae bacterium NR047]|nr:TIGR03773 family transporter-associated surface protein [Bifidobacteriaceae bacterium NR047]
MLKNKNYMLTKNKNYVATSIIAAIFAAIMVIAAIFMPSPFVSVANATTSNQPVMIQAGHADFGPTLAGGYWKIQIRDDTGDDPVWRDPENVVFKLGSSSIIPMPNDAAYNFIGEKPGTKLYVIPQTQNPNVPWLGWNTQEGGVLNELDRGAKLSLEGVSGPGKLHVYLENGNNNPQQLWDSTKGYPQNSWIETNAHTHVNWVFSKPGIYHVKLTFSGKLKNGRAVSDTRVLNFAVGDNTDPNAALGAGAAAGAGAGANSGDEDSSNDEEGGEEGSESGASDNGENAEDGESGAKAGRHHKKASSSDDTVVIAQIVMIIFVIVTIVIIAFVMFAVAKSKKARREAINQHDSSRGDSRGDSQPISQNVSRDVSRNVSQQQATMPTQYAQNQNSLSDLVNPVEETTVLPSANFANSANSNNLGQNNA